MVWGERYTLVRGSPTHCHEMTLETIAKCILPVTEQPVPRHFAVIVSIKTNTIIPTNKLFRKLSKITIHVTACESCCDTVLGRNSAGFKLFSAIPESSSGCEEVKATVLLKMMPELYSLWHFVAVTINGHVKMIAGWKKKSTKNSATVLGLDMALTQMHTHAHRDIYTNTHTRRHSLSTSPSAVFMPKYQHQSCVWSFPGDFEEDQVGGNCKTSSLDGSLWRRITLPFAMTDLTPLTWKQNQLTLIIIQKQSTSTNKKQQKLLLEIILILNSVIPSSP